MKKRFNRPGLSWVPYRAGTHESFLAAMKAALTSASHTELGGLTTRERSDPSMALLDAWAMVADVLTFYGERDANEGYLRTATEDRSVFELARLIGYRQRPGVAASVYLAFGVEKNARLTIKRGSRVSSVPGPGQLPQTYETSADLVARAEWSALRPRLAVPQTALAKQQVLYFKGANLGLKPNDPLLLVRDDDDDDKATPVRFARVQSATASFERNLTTVVLEPAVVKPVVVASVGVAEGAAAGAPRPAEASYSKTALDIAHRFRHPEPLMTKVQWLDEPNTQLNSAVVSDVLAELDPSLSSEALQTVASNAEVTPHQRLAVYAFRMQSGPFGHAAPKRPVFERAEGREGERTLVGYEEWELGRNGGVGTDTRDREDEVGFEQSRTITLDSPREAIGAKSWVAIVRPEEGKPKRALSLWRANTVETVSRADYGVSARATRIALKEALKETGTKDLTVPSDLEAKTDWKGWLQPEVDAIRNGEGTRPAIDLTALRETVVFAQSERLELADKPADPILTGRTIELDGFFAGIEAGRTLIVEGERADLLDSPAPRPAGDVGEPSIKSSGVRAAHVVQIVKVDQDATHGAGDSLHTHLVITPAIDVQYKTDTVTIYGNVVPATHGETRPEVLGSGDGATSYQRFTLKQSPITFVPAATPSGVASTLEVRVNDLQWHEVPSLVEATGDEWVFTTVPAEDGGVQVMFGDGTRGARVPTGVENVKAQYRIGIGSAGNAAAGQISQLMDRPLGAKDVRNPLPALGGADPDTARQARTLAPLTVQALDRLVSAADYQHFAQLFAGIAKATASETWSGAHARIIVAVAAAGGMSIAGSGLQTSLLSALRQFGDPSQLVDVVDVERHLLVVKAGIRLQADYLFEAVRPQIEGALFEAFGFDRRRLGDDLHLSEVVSVIHGVRGVRSVDVDIFATISDADVTSEAAFDAKILSLTGARLPPERLPLASARSGAMAGDLQGAGWLVYLSPRVPRALLLEEIW